MKNLRAIIIMMVFIIPSITFGMTNITAVKPNKIFNQVGGVYTPYTLSTGGGAGPYEITSGNIEVNYGVALIVETSLYFGTDAGIIVHPGGLLILKGDIFLSSKNGAVAGWAGIQVEGGAKNYCVQDAGNFVNTTWFSAHYSICDFGLLYINKSTGNIGPTIEKSLYGAISGTWKTSTNAIDVSKTGGIIQAYYGVFKNNYYMGLGFANHFSSVIDHTRFVTTNAMTVANTKYVNIISSSAATQIANNVTSSDKQITFAYCNFENSGSNVDITGISSQFGIFATDCLIFGIKYGININHLSSKDIGTIKIQLCGFNYGTLGINIQNGKNAMILYNIFNGTLNSMSIANNSTGTICNGNVSKSFTGGSYFNTKGLTLTNNGNKNPNQANFNYFYDGVTGIEVSGPNGSFTTKCNTFDATVANIATHDIFVKANGNMANPHGVCGAQGWTPGNTFTANYNPAGWFNIESQSNNMVYRWNSLTSTTNPYYVNTAHVNKQSCNSTAVCVNDIKKPISYAEPVFYDPSIQANISRYMSIVDSITHISNKSADDSALIDYYSGNRTFYESQLLSYYAANSKYDSALIMLNNDTNFMVDYLKMNLYLQLDSFTDAQTLANTYSGYSGNDTDLLDFYTYYNLLITGLQDTNFNNWLNVHHTDMYNLGERNSIIAGEAKIWYNKWVEDNPDSSGTEFNFITDTTNTVDTVHVVSELYPNPANNYMTAKITNNDVTTGPTFTHKTTDMYGTLKETHTITVPAGTTGQYTYDVSAYPTGIYYFYVLKSSYIYSVKLFIKY